MQDESIRPSITLNDIASVVEVLKVCTERGVWKVGELSSIGQLYDKLNSFLEIASNQLPKSDPSETNPQQGE